MTSTLFDTTQSDTLPAIFDAERSGPCALFSELSRAIYTGAHGYAGGRLHDDVCLLLARRQ